MSEPIFDGRATVYSECRRCGQLMVVIDDHCHPTCEPKPTRLESLAIGLESAMKAGDDEAAELTADEMQTLENQPPRLKESALYYARWGWPVHPLRAVGGQCYGGDKCRDLCQCPKTPATRNGFKDATTDYAQIEKWWRPNVNYNIGLATGHLFDVIDIDPRSGGDESFQKLLDDKRLPDIHAVARTASGGMHLYITPTGKGNSAGWMPGIDHRGIGGYCVGPPSTLGKPGRSWSWMVAPSPAIKETR